MVRTTFAHLAHWCTPPGVFCLAGYVEETPKRIHRVMPRVFLHPNHPKTFVPDPLDQACAFVVWT